MKLFSKHHLPHFSLTTGYKLLLVCLALLCTAAFAEDELIELPCPEHTNMVLPPQVMTLREAVLLSLRNNPDVRNAELQRVVDKYALAVAYNQFEPQYSFTANYTIGTDQTPAYSILPQVTFATPFGTSISANINETLDGSAVSTVTLTQPLMRGLNPEVVQANLFTQQQTEKINRLTLKNQVITTVVQVVQAYTLLVQDFRNVEINEYALRDAKTTLQQTLLKIKAGKAAETEQDQQQVNVATQALALEQAKNSLQQDYQNLLIVLGLNPSANIVTEKTVHMPTAPLPCMDEAIHLALENNIAYQTALVNYKITERNLVVAEDTQKWILNLTATASHDLGAAGDTGTPVVGTIVSGGIITTDVIETGVETTKSLNLNLTVPIDDLQIKQTLINAKIGIQQAKISLENQRNQLVTSVVNSLRSLCSLKKQIEISEYQVRFAQKSLDVAKIKYNYGKTTSFELTTLQSNLREAQTNLVNQQINYINTLEQFYQTLGTTLCKWKVIVDF